MIVPVRVFLVWATLVLVTGSHTEFAWNTLLSCAFTVAVLVFVIRATSAANWRVVWIVFLIYFGVGWINTLNEAVLFQILPISTGFEALASGAITAFTVAVLLALSLDRMKGSGDPPDTALQSRAPIVWIWKAAVSACLYFFLYCVAGAAIHPFIEAFYDGRKLPSLGELFVIQFLRGLLYVAVTLPFIRSIALPRSRAAITLGACLSILGGIAPLLLPNQYMPLSIRVPHLFEVGISNFVYGVLLGYIMIPGDSLREIHSQGTSSTQLVTRKAR